MTTEGITLTRDILSNIAPKMDDETLALLYAYPTYRDSLKFILKTREFWYERSSNLIGKSLTWRSTADWKSIYYALKDISPDEWRGGEYDLALSDLDTLLTIEEAYGPLLVTKYHHGRYSELLSDIDDPRVFDYVISKEPGRRYSLWLILERQIERQNRAIIDKLLSLVRTYKAKSYESPIASPIRAARKGDLKTLLFLMENVDINLATNLGYILTAAIEGDQLSVYEYLTDIYPDIAPEMCILKSALQDRANSIFRKLFESMDLSDDEKHELLSDAAGYGSEKIFSYLTSLLDDIDWISLLEIAVQDGSEAIIELIMPHIDPRVDLSLLPWNFPYPSAKIISLILQGPNSSPVPKLDQILDTVRRDQNAYHMTLALMNDPRVRTESLSRDAVLKIYSIIGGGGVDRDFQFIAAIPEKVRELLASPDSITGTDIYSLTLREMALKRPGKLALVDWMIEMNDPDLALAAASVIDTRQKCPEALIPIQQLMHAMLYPTLTIKEQMYELRREHRPSSTLLKAEAILSRYYYLTES